MPRILGGPPPPGAKGVALASLGVGPGGSAADDEALITCPDKEPLMPVVHTRYVTYTAAGRRRHPGSSAADITPPFDNTVSSSPYTDWAPPTANWTDGDGVSHSANFAFWSVTGGADGAFVSTNPALSVPVGDTPIGVTAWYLPTGGDGIGEPGTYIDAFDVDVGDFFDDDFVSVAPDTDLSFNANELGLVPTRAPEQITAFASIGPRLLQSWQLLVVSPPGADSVNGAVLSTATKSMAVAFAFYQRPRGGSTIPKLDGRVYEAGVRIIFGVTADGGGLTDKGPVPPWEPLVRELANAMALAYAGRQGGAETRLAVVTAAAKQLGATAAKLGRAMVEEAKLGL